MKNQHDHCPHCGYRTCTGPKNIMDHKQTIADLRAEVEAWKEKHHSRAREEDRLRSVLFKTQKERDELLPLLSLLDTIKEMTDCEWTQERIVTVLAALKRREGE